MGLKRAFFLGSMLLCTAGLTPPAGASGGPDPFYVGLMRDGRTALARGDASGAKRDLRLACFGFLDHPALLAECRIRLGLAEAALGDRDAFLESFTRIEELQERFQAYAAAAVTAEERGAFEAKVVEWVAPEVLRSIPAFAPVLERKAEADFAKLAPRERTRELERRVAAQPGVARWKLLLAEDELARGRPAPALARLEKLPDAAEGGGVACARGRALAELERCDEAVKSLAACSTTASVALLAELELGCLVELDRADEARAFAATLSAAIASRPEIQKRVARIPAPPKPKVEAPPRAAEKRQPAGADRKAGAETAKPTKGAEAESGKKPAASEPVSTGKSRREETTATAPRSSSPVSKSAPPAAPEQTAPAALEKAAPAALERAAPAAAPAGKLSAAEQAVVADVRKLLRSSARREELEAALGRIRPIADRNPQQRDLQLLSGEIGYRAGSWKVGADYLLRPDAAGPADPTLRFYLAVCQYESGDRAAASRTAATGLDKLQRSPFVDGYLRKILGAP